MAATRGMYSRLRHIFIERIRAIRYFSRKSVGLPLYLGEGGEGNNNRRLADLLRYLNFRRGFKVTLDSAFAAEHEVVFPFLTCFRATEEAGLTSSAEGADYEGGSPYFPATGSNSADRTEILEWVRVIMHYDYRSLGVYIRRHDPFLLP